MGCPSLWCLSLWTGKRKAPAPSGAEVLIVLAVQKKGTRGAGTGGPAFQGVKIYNDSLEPQMNGSSPGVTGE